MQKTKKPRRAWPLRIIFLLWLTMLAYGLPEVIAGTGSMWIITPGAYIFAAPLYVLHFLVLVQIAQISGRISWPALYLFGVIFGLYETWITKVVWAGYPGEDGFAFGFLGPYFGVHEMLGLVLFYHAVISFLLPLAVLSRLFPAWGQVFPVPTWVFGQGRWALLRRLGLLFMLGVVTAHNNPDPAAYLITWVPFLVVLILGYLLVRRSENPRVTTPRLSKPGFAIALVGLAAIYGFGYVLFRPEDTPPPDALAATALLYLILVALLWRIRRNPPELQAFTPQAAPARMPMLWLLAIFMLGAAMLVLPGLRGLFAIPAFLGMVALGVVLMLWLGLWRGAIRRR